MNTNKSNEWPTLTPQELYESVPGLNATKQDDVKQHIAYVRYFSVLGAYRAYILEYDPKTRIAFGVATTGDDWEFGYIDINGLEKIPLVKNVPLIEIDEYFEPCELGEIEELAEFLSRF